KVFSTPDDPSRAIAEAIKQVGHADELVILHGTTVGTNTLLQRKGARVAFVTTKGFEDSIQIGRQARPELYDFFFDAVEPLAPAELRFGISERTDKDGYVLVAPPEKDVAELVRRIRAATPDAVAVSLLFSFANTENEERVAAALAKLKLPLSISHQILPEFREYERASTVAMNAYLQPVMQSYLEKLRGRFPQAKVFVMQSSGGLTSLETASHEPVRTVLSGPAGGVVGAVKMSGRTRKSGATKIIGFDMGGTSTDVCLVESEPMTTNESEIAGLPIRVPMLNIHTVGAGGGSIARFDAGGALRVGPESAGAAPGPICYGQGTLPTVTDANLLLGRLREDHFLGGSFRLQRERTERICNSWLRKQKSDWTLRQFAEGVVRVVNANMEKAIRVVSVEKGYDPREFSLVAFGGAGALHACELASALEIPTVVIPHMPGALSAVGILLSDVVKDYARTILLRVPGKSKWPKAELQRWSTGLRQRAAKEFAAEGWKGKIQFKPSLDMRYKGQGFEISVEMLGNPVERFHAEHLRRFGYAKPEREIEIVTVRLRGWQAGADLGRKLLRARALRSRKGNERRTAVVFEGKVISTPVVGRDAVKGIVKGPAIVTEYSATTVIPPGWSGQIEGMSLVLRNKK
ncbi:MAG TPA: hydantoinase/oxoprolinase family protein, partial [Terriglobales bacterium]|nr:hydantoinase/oxoprolinase family protein [Terriglobales bacterium]